MKLLAEHRGERRGEKSSKYQAYDDGPGVGFHQQGKNRGARQGEKKLCEIDRPDCCPGVVARTHQRGCDDRPPATSSSRIDESAEQCQFSDMPWHVAAQAQGAERLTEYID